MSPVPMLRFNIVVTQLFHDLKGRLAHDAVTQTQICEHFHST